MAKSRFGRTKKTRSSTRTRISTGGRRSGGTRGGGGRSNAWRAYVDNSPIPD
jgi:hypothetical protein